MPFDVQVDEENSPEWEQIKNYVGGANKTTKHPLQQEIDRNNMRNPQYFEEGGEVGMPQDPNAPQIVPGGTMPSAPPPAPVAPPPMAPSPIPSPTNESYNKQASDVMGGITPETIQNLVDKLNAQQRKGQVGAGIGDAIGSVGGTNPGHMKNVEEQLNKNREFGLKVPGEMATLGKERYGLSQELQAKDPNSPYSRVVQNSYRETLKTMGATDKDINTMAASTIDAVVGHKVTLADALAKNKLESTYRLGEQDIQRQALGQTGAHQKEEERIAKEKNVQEAAKALENKGMFKSILDMVPGTAGHTANKVLEKQATESSFDHSAIPSGSIYTAPDGTKRRKK